MRGGNSGFGDAASRVARLSDAQYRAELALTARRLRAEQEAREEAEDQPLAPEGEGL